MSPDKDKVVGSESDKPMSEKSVRQKLQLTGWLWVVEAVTLIVLVFFRHR